MLEVKNLSYSYTKNNNILNNISFDANYGEITLLLGKNGQGKSTILKLIDRIIKNKSSEIFVDGVNVNNIKLNDLAKIISYVGQTSNMAPLTVFETVMLGRIPHYRGMESKHDYERVESILNDLEITDLANRNISTLSGGELQLVSIARALAQETRIILLDEPMNNLDIENQIIISNVIKKLAKEKNIMFIITMHDLNFSLSLGDKFLFLKDHELVYSGSRELITSEVIKNVYNIDTEIIEYKKEKIVVYGGIKK